MPSSSPKDPVVDVGGAGGVPAVGGERPASSDVAFAKLQELRERGAIEAERRNLLLQVPMPTALLTGPQHVFELANPLYREMIGNRDVVGKTWIQVFPELVGSAFPAILDRVYESGESFVSPESLVPLDRNGDGEPEDCFFRFSLHPLRDAESRVYGMIAAAVDITEQVNARHALEIALSDRERLLREVEVGRKRLHALFENAPAFVCILRGPDHVFELVNPLFQRLVGKDRALVGLPARDGMPEMVEQGFIGLLDGVYRTGEPFIGREAKVRLDLLGDGVLEEAFVTFVYQPMRSDQGQIEGIDVFGFEVTDHVRTRQKAEALAVALGQRADFEQQLIGIVSHDLRNPLNVIGLGAASLLGREELDERSTKAITRIQTAAGRATRMIRDLLDFTQARVGSGIHIERRPARFHDVTREVLDEVEASHPDRDLRVQSSGDGDGEWDPDRIAQVVQNLVTNALKYSPAGSAVHVETRGEGGVVILTVQNQGSPILPDALGRLFEPMKRATSRSDSASRSIGLGLYIVKHIIDAHQGTIEVESSAAAGTTFTVRLPKRSAPRLSPRGN